MIYLIFYLLFFFSFCETLSSLMFILDIMEEIASNYTYYYPYISFIAYYIAPFVYYFNECINIAYDIYGFYINNEVWINLLHFLALLILLSYSILLKIFE